MTDDATLADLADLMERSRHAVERYLNDCENGEFLGQTVGDLAGCVTRWMAWRLNAEEEEQG